MAIGDLTSVGRVRDYLKLTTSADDGLIQALVTRVSEWAKSRMSRQIVRTTFTKRLNGNGRPSWMAPEYPILAVTSVMIGGTTLVAERDYWFDEDSIYFKGWTLTKGVGNVTIIWEAGYDTVPEDLDEAVAEIVAFAYQERDRIGATSKSIGGETIAFIAKSGPARPLETLNLYEKVVPV